MFLFTILDQYMLFLEQFKSEFNVTDNPVRNLKDMANSPELLRIRKVFVDHQDVLTEKHKLTKLIVQLLPGAELDRKKMVTDLLPQFILYALRIFDVYDSAMSGLTVEETVELMKHQEAEKKTPQRPKAQTEEDAIKTALGEKMLGQFGRPQFWQHRYDGITPDFKPHDWYVSWGTIKDRVWQFTGMGLPTSAIKEGKTAAGNDAFKPISVLNLGCGNSLLAEALVDDLAAKVERVVSIDFVESVVKAQEERVKNTKFEKKCEFKTMDVLKMDELPESSFDLIVDKGTLDSLLTTSTAATDFADACKQISRLMKPNGWFVMVSCAIGYDQIKPLQNLNLFKWKVVHVSEMPADGNQETKINMLMVQRLSDADLQAAIEESKAKSAASSSAPAAK